MNREYYFATPIYVEALKDAADLNSFLEKNILEWEAQTPTEHKTNVKGWHSPNMIERKEYHPLMREILKICEKIFELEKLAYKPAIGNMWANINYPDGYNRPHTHPNCLFSGSYYIKVPDPKGRLIIHDPRPGVHLLLPKRTEDILPKQLWKQIFFQPKAGHLIIFPAWLWHEVEPNQGKDNRISIAFNIIQQ